MDQKKPARPSRRRASSPTTPNAVEIAMEAEAAGHVPEGAAAEVLRRHAQLLGWQTAGERAGFALKVLTGVVGVIVAGALITLIWSSSRYQGLVVQAFSAPPDLIERGLTGEVLAGDLMDRLVSMQEQTTSVRAPGSYSIDWSDGAEVEIPQTGVSIGELQRYLRTWLGKETRISGVVYRRQDGQLAVTARTGGSASATFVGPEADLERLMISAAESVYARTQPYRYTVYLADQNEKPRPSASGGPPNAMANPSRSGSCGAGLWRSSIEAKFASPWRSTAGFRPARPTWVRSTRPWPTRKISSAMPRPAISPASRPRA